MFLILYKPTVHHQKDKEIPYLSSTDLPSKCTYLFPIWVWIVLSKTIFVFLSNYTEPIININSRWNIEFFSDVVFFILNRFGRNVFILGNIMSRNF